MLPLRSPPIHLLTPLLLQLDLTKANAKAAVASAKEVAKLASHGEIEIHPAKFERNFSFILHLVHRTLTSPSFFAVLRSEAQKQQKIGF
mmetsp:Transcript_34917/g.90469  ORF Transcript_34917/g.90469 Transcript_34917/m.90469 type:complete len:89 (+) Transcript_34917:261-527(+)